MKTGDTITAEVRGKEVILMLDDEVLPDRTRGQYDHGFWAFEVGNEAYDFFVSNDGVVWGLDPAIRNTDSYTLEVGKVVTHG